MKQALKNSVHGVLQVCQFILVHAKKIYAYYEFMYAFFSIAYCSLSTKCPCLSLFFYNTPRELFCFVECFSRKIPYANLHQIMCYRYFT